MINQKIINYLYTIKNLKYKQIFYRIYYAARKKNKASLIKFLPKKSYSINLRDGLYSYKSHLGQNTFLFLNQKHQFKEKINWNYTGYGKLWAYNLNYFEFLHQPEFDKETGIRLIHDFIDQYKNIDIGYDSYPLSLRNVFWIKFISKYAIQNEQINAFLYASYKLLLRYLEYHLLGNHLLENAFSLLYGAYYFQDEIIYHKAYRLLISELKEQILSDGGHFELSPMYHQILLYRLLDCINLVSGNKWIEDDLFEFLCAKAADMLGWLKNMTFPSGTIPFLNDATGNIAPLSSELFAYAERLHISPLDLPLSDSCYRIFQTKNYKCIMDIGGIAPSYQPGHAHADTFNFVLEVGGHPFIVDTGCSTYETNDRRLFERGTSAHNTVTVNGLNSSQVWASHRVGKRTEVKILEDISNKIVAEHTGYQSIGKTHRRTFLKNDNGIKIIDEIKGVSQNSQNTAHFYFDSSIENIRINEKTVNTEYVLISFKGSKIVFRFEEYDQALSFNGRKHSKCICVDFDDYMETTITF
jgi:hypothetical protein